MTKKITAVALLVWASLAPHAHAADQTLTIQHQGIERRAIVFGRVGQEPQPLIVALHGLGQTVTDLRGQLRLDATAAKNGVLIAYPEALDRTWNYGRPLAGGAPIRQANGAPVDDAGFLRALIASLVDAKQVDPSRVFVAGVSRGGLMAFAAACALADQIAGAAPLITGMTDMQREDCKPTRPVPMIVFAGTNDRAQFYDGALTARGRLMSVAETMEFWRGVDGCKSQTWRLLPHRNPDDATQVTVTDWGECEAGARVRLYRIEGGGHQLPTAVPATPDQEKRFGLRNRDLETADEIWSNFRDLKR